MNETMLAYKTRLEIKTTQQFYRGYKFKREFYYLKNGNNIDDSLEGHLIFITM